MSHQVQDLEGEVWKSVSYTNTHHVSNLQRVAEIYGGFRVSLLPIDKGAVVINNRIISVEDLYKRKFSAEIREVERKNKEEARQELNNTIFEDSKENDLINEPIDIDEKIIEEKPKKLPIIILTDDQKFEIDKLWDESPIDSPPSVADLVKSLFGPDFNGLTPEALAIRKHLAEKGLKPKRVVDIYEERKAQQKQLTEDQKEFITNNCSDNSILEMTKTLFPEIPKVSNFSYQYRAVKEFAESLENVVLYKTEKTLTDEKYRPPETLAQAVKRVNKYIPNAIDETEMVTNTKVQKQMKNLVSFMHMYRFLLLINNINNYQDRDFFESQYVRYTWDALDITEADLDLICNLCLDIVNFSNLQKELEQLRAIRDQGMEEKDGRLSMAVVKQIEDIRADMKENQKRQASTIESLQGTRNERAESKLKESRSMLQVVESWREEEKRKKIIAYANKKKDNAKKEIVRLESLESIKAEIFGLSQEAY